VVASRTQLSCRRRNFVHRSRFDARESFGVSCFAANEVWTWAEIEAGA
jgi:hypothetical protein